jgi:hypothetical protein
MKRVGNARIGNSKLECVGEEEEGEAKDIIQIRGVSLNKPSKTAPNLLFPYISLRLVG